MARVVLTARRRLFLWNMSFVIDVDLVVDLGEVYQEDNLEFESGFGNIIVVDNLRWIWIP
ncbi:hypothetical protein JHK85_009430 [Glycine max]|nr:hypothetical protein JHK85_009430 [Glycine max]KAG5065443.1 hypothetical protein JHK86_009174 [Glycine max]